MFIKSGWHGGLVGSLYMNNVCFKVAPISIFNTSLKCKHCTMQYAIQNDLSAQKPPCWLLYTN